MRLASSIRRSWPPFLWLATLFVGTPVCAWSMGVAANERWQSAAGADEPAQVWQWTDDRLQGPEGLNCRPPRHELRRIERSALASLIGNDPGQLAALMASQGFSGQAVPLQRIRCEDTTLDLLHLTDGRALALSAGRAWTVRRVAVDNSPLASVQQLLLAHSATPMGLSPARVKSLARWLSPSLASALTQHLARRVAPGSVPAIPLDPFTGAEEIPARLWFEPAVVAQGAAIVIVHEELEGIGRPDHRIVYSLRRIGGRWRVDDIRYLDGSVTLRRLMAR